MTLGRSLTPQTISTLNIHPVNPIVQQGSPGSNQIRLISSSQSVPSASYVAGNINLTQSQPTSVFSSYQIQHDQQQPILVPPAQTFSNSSVNGVLKDRNIQQQQQTPVQIDKRTRSFKEPLPMKLTTVNETHALTVHEGQVRLNKIMHLNKTIEQERFNSDERTINTYVDTNSKKKRDKAKIKSFYGKLIYYSISTWRCQ